MNIAIKTVKLDKKLVGHILQNNDQFFYRPSKTPKIKTPHSPITDGSLFSSLKECYADIIGDGNPSQIEFSPYLKK